MATPLPTYFAPTGDALVDGMTHGYVWRLGADRTIDWSISGGWYGEYWNDPAGLQANISQTLNTISYVANVRFNYVGHYANPGTAYAAGSEINIAGDARNAFFGGPSMWARAFFPRRPVLRRRGRRLP